MKMTLRYEPETGLLEIHSSSGVLPVTQTEAAALYSLLRRALGFRGRFKLWMNRRMFSKIESGMEQ